MQTRQAQSVPHAPLTARSPAKAHSSEPSAKQKEAAPAPAVPPPLPSLAPQLASAAEPAVTPDDTDDFPIGWELRKDSWNFHRRFYRIFRRPMRLGEYSHLLWQIRRRKAEHLWDDCWRVSMPGGSGTLAVRATTWQLITILPKGWEPPVVAPRAE